MPCYGLDVRGLPSTGVVASHKGLERRRGRRAQRLARRLGGPAASGLERGRGALPFRASVVVVSPFSVLAEGAPPWAGGCRF